MTTNQTQGTTWPTDAEREVFSRALHGLWSSSTEVCHGCADCDRDAGRILAVLAIHVARRERDAAARALRDAEREARERGDIGKDDGPEAWAWLAHLADRVERGEP